MKHLLASPFVHFLLLGFGIFILYGWLNKDANHPEGYDIIITEDQQVQLAVNHQRNFGEIPDQKTLNQLIEAEIQSEIFYREALKMGLDENDEIIKRRLKQKYTFIKEDSFIESEPTIDELKAFYNQHADRYYREPRFSFHHYYFNPDKRNDPGKDALKFIQDQSLKPDPFHIYSPISNQTLSELRNVFGFDFAETIKDVTTLDSLIHIRSGFGHHVIRISNLESKKLKPFESIQEMVGADFQRNYRNERNKVSYEKVKKKYNIQIEELE